MNNNMDTESAAYNLLPNGGSDATFNVPGANNTPIMIHPLRRQSQAGWTLHEDTLLAKAVHKYKNDWHKIAKSMPTGRTHIQCSARWNTVLDPTIVKGPWSEEEDSLLRHLVKYNGPRNWSFICKLLPGRLGKQCRERWEETLNPLIYKGTWSEEEDRTILQHHAKYGNNWAKISTFLPGRTGKCVKNHWNSSLHKRVAQSSSSSVNVQSQQTTDRKTITLFGVQLSRPENNTSTKPQNSKTANSSDYLNNFKLDVGRGARTVFDNESRSSFRQDFCPSSSANNFQLNVGRGGRDVFNDGSRSSFRQDFCPSSSANNFQLDVERGSRT